MNKSILVSLLLSAAPLLAQTPTAETQKLEAFLGTWTTEGASDASPLGPASRHAGIVRGEWCPGGFALLRYEDSKDGSGKTERSLLIFYYDTASKSYQGFAINPSGQNGTATVSFGADAMTWTWDIPPIQGKRYLYRGTLKPLSADVRDYIGEYSEDGKTWKVIDRSKDSRKK